MKFFAQAAKAVYAAVAALLTGLAAVLVGNQSLSDVTTAQWITLALATLGAFGAVYGVTNKP